jgi:1-deoxyxylulose-5-phosphate synthase
VQHVNLGASGLRVSRLGLGTMTFGLRCDEQTSLRIVDEAADAGITLIDTADVYPYAGDLNTVGVTEAILGRALRGRRDDFLIATKVGGETGQREWDRGNSRKHIIKAVESSLVRLQTDYVDIIQLHGFDDSTPLSETVEALDALVAAGKARYAGVSNFRAYQLAMIACCARESGRVRVATTQPRYNLLCRGAERETFAAAQALGVGTLVYNPLAGGLLTGKHHYDRPPQDGRFSLGSAAAVYRHRYWNPGAFAALDSLKLVATQAGLSLPTLALAWILANRSVHVVLVGASSPDHVAHAVSAAGVELDADVIETVEGLTAEFRLAEEINAGLPRRESQ